MRLPTIFLPKTTLSQEETRRGLRILTLECVASTGFSSMTSSAFLIAFALLLGASNFQIGILASIPWITDLFQIPAVWLIEKFRQRKIIVAVTWLTSQLLWIPIALLPLIIAMPGAGAISILIGLMAIRGILNAFSNCGWSSWMRDLIPQQILGRYFARRLSLATAASIVLGLSAAFFLDRWNAAGYGAMGYTWVFLTGLVFFGLTSPALTAFIPEPEMQPAVPLTSFWQTITAPLCKRNYRQLMKFLMLWGFASSIALPFFEVFMLKGLSLPIFLVVILSIITEACIAISLRIWGPIADRLGSKVVMFWSTSLFLLMLIGWSIVALQWRHIRLIPALGALHIIEGIALAGILLAEEALSLKLAPREQATSFTAGASLADSIGTGTGVLVGGFAVDFFDEHILSPGLSVMSLLPGIDPDRLQITGFCFLFMLSFLLGLVTLRTLHTIQEADTARDTARKGTRLQSATSAGTNRANKAVFRACPALEVNRPIGFPDKYINISMAQGKRYNPGFSARSSIDATPILSDEMRDAKRGLQKKPPSPETW